jgi:molybdopterin-containing oxidoreductase family membrane subunit
MTEWKITAGIWAGGFLVLTIALKIALPVLTGEASLANEKRGEG